jgi:tetratricopeptide (TPR) repeat protein
MAFKTEFYGIIRNTAIMIVLLNAANSFSQDAEEIEALEITERVQEGIRYDALLDYEFDFERVRYFLTVEQRYECHYALALQFDKKYDYARALKHALEASKYAEKLNDLPKQGEMHLRLSNIHLDVQNGNEAIESAKAAVEVFERIQDSTALIDAYNNMANAQMSTGQFISGLVWYSQALELAKLTENDEMAMVPISNIGAYYLFRGEADSAMSFIDKAIEFDRYSRNRSNLAMAYGNKAYAYTLKENYNLAHSYFDSSFAIANEDNLKLVLLNLYKDRSDMYYGLRDYERSYADLIQYQRINDSLKSSVSSEQISDWKAAFANEEKKAEEIKEQARLVQEKHDKELQSYRTWSITAIGVLITAVFLTLLWRYRTTNKKNREILKLSELLQKKEIKENKGD